MYSKKCEEVASPKIKLPWKSRLIYEKGNRHLKKKAKLNWWLRLIETIFPEMFMRNLVYLSWWPQTTNKEIIRTFLYYTIFNIVKVVCITNKKIVSIPSYG